MSTTVDINKEIENFEKVKDILAHLYLYSSDATVELSPKLYDIVSKARTIEEGKNENEIIIDGQVYTYDIDDEVAIDYFESSERDLKEVRREARRLYKEFKKRGKNELLAFLENDTPDFYVASIIALEKEE